jgi:hypothetical protein
MSNQAFLRLFLLSQLLSSVSACGSDPAPKEATDESEEPSRPRKDGGSTGSTGKVDSGRPPATKDEPDEQDEPDEPNDEADDEQDPPDDREDPPTMDAGAGATKDAEAPSEPQADAAQLEPFSFFVTSLKAMRQLSKSQDGFGGDLRFGETGEGAGLRGADKICETIAEMSMPGSKVKSWRAFLSTTKGGADGGPVHAKDRIGEGPWYDRLGRLVAKNKTDLIQPRPAGADATIKNDLPNEDGVPNHNPDNTGEVDNHDILTGTNDKGELYKNDVRATCDDWTKSEADAADAPRVGHSWPRMGGFGGGGGGPRGLENWMSALDEAGCGPSVGLIEMGPPRESDPTVGSGGGYGGIYCFALTP